MKRTQITLTSIAILSVLLGGVFALDFSDSEVNSSQTNFITPAEASIDGVFHDIQLEAVELPDGMYAYRMVEHLICDQLIDESCDPEDLPEDVTQLRYASLKPSVPGPTLIFTEGDKAKITLKNSVPCEDYPDLIDSERETPEIARIGIHVHGVHYSVANDGTPEKDYGFYSSAECGAEVSYIWNADDGTRGAWPYHDHTFQSENGGEHLGLFGAIIVNPRSGMINGIVSSDFETEGDIIDVPVGEIDKEYVLWMVSSEVLGRNVFYGMEIDHDIENESSSIVRDTEGVGRQTPLWVNPPLLANENDLLRFHVLGMGDEVHAFHLHGHRWIEPTEDSGNIIDVREISPLERHTFLVEASSNGVSASEPENWMYHCHVFSHMQEGMAGKFTVLPDGEDDTLPTIGAVFTISDEPGLWYKTLDAGKLDGLDETLATVLDGTVLDGAVEPRAGIGFAPDYLGVLNEDFGDTKARSLAVINVGETVLYNMKDSQTLHTVTTALWPTAASSGPFTDQELAIRGSTFVADEDGVPITFDEPGLYVNVCKIHPYMFSAIVVDDKNTNLPPATGEGILDEGVELPLLEIGSQFSTLIDVTPAGIDATLEVTDPTDLEIIKALLKTHYVITDQANWKDYRNPTWDVNVVPAFLTAGEISGATTVIRPDTAKSDWVPVAEALLGLNLTAAEENGDIIALGLEIDSSVSMDDTFEPNTPGIGEVWINTQFEQTTNKNPLGTPQDKPGTVTVVDAKKWGIERKISLPEINMNHPHNMWTDVKNEVVYQTQWFDKTMVTIDRESGELIKNGFVGQSPSHVMTLPGKTLDNPRAGNVMIAMNGEEQVTEIDPNTQEIIRQISVGEDSHPHGHWISHDGRFIVTPNPFTNTSTVIDLDDPDNPVITQTDSDEYPIATGMMPDASKYYVANFFGNTITVYDPENPSTPIDTINLLAEGGLVGLPIQTPVSPDGKWMVTANVLDLLGKGPITIVDTDDPTNPIVAQLPCDPGCHGVQWGAKQDGGYYAYVSSKFSNALIVVDPDPDLDGNANDAEIVGRIILTEQFETESDDRIIGLDGMGGQGVLAIPNVYNGWIQDTVSECGNKADPCSEEVVSFLKKLHNSQKNP
jgi:hypothetical protein